MSKKILIILLIQTLMLFYMIANKQWTLNTGEAIVLETLPIDPRSLFRGDYVILNYAISTIELEKVEGDNIFQVDDYVYVTLEQKGDYWQAVAVYNQYPDKAAQQKVIRGRVNYLNYSSYRRHRKIKPEAIQRINVRYGIENYFVPEGEGKELERRVPDRKISLQVAVDGFGRAGIRAVLFNGVAEYTETLF